MAKSKTLAAQRLRSSAHRFKRIRNSRKLNKAQKAEMNSAIEELESIASQMEEEAKSSDHSAWFKLVSQALVVFGKVIIVFRKI